MIDRRSFLAASALAAALPLRLAAQAGRTIPQRASARVIVDNDFAGDPDGLAALAHQLLSPKARVPLITASAIDPKFAAQDPTAKAMLGRTAAAGRDLAGELVWRMGVPSPAIVAGAEDFSPAASPSAAARAIVAEAMRDDPLPLFVTCGGPLTNVAAALRLAPAIAKRMTVVWIGGGAWPDGGWEYNLATDAPAARAVIERSSVPVWQVPQDAYRQMQYSIAEMTADLRPLSPFAAWLYDRFTMPPDFIDLGGTWPLGDTPLVLLTAVSAESSRFRDRPARAIGPDFRYGAPIPGRTIRVFDTIDARLAFGDFLAKLRLHAAR